MLTVYLFTLAPEVTLEWSGIMSAGAMYAGVQSPPGNPVWTLYAWLFTWLLPFSNIAWRVAVSSAVAGALTCGVVALMVSRGSAAMLEEVRGFKRLSARDEASLRVVCGAVAGMALGFHRVLWSQAVIVESTALGLLLFSIVLCLLLRWVQDPELNRYLYAAFFTYGLAVTVNLSLAAASPGLLWVILFRKPSLGRDLFFAAALCLFATLLLRTLGVLPQFVAEATQLEGFRKVYLVVGIGTGLVCALMTLLTGRLLTHWRTACAITLLLMAAFSVIIYLPLASMTNPPNNWGYPRTVEGFFHLISRGQFEHVHPTSDFGPYLRRALAVCATDGP